MKRKLILFATICFCAALQAQVVVPIRLEPDEQEDSNLRSQQFSPTAALDGSALTVTFPQPTDVRLLIVDRSTQTTVYSGTFASPRSIVLDLEDESIAAGTYTLRINAFGVWWSGEFVLFSNGINQP